MRGWALPLALIALIALVPAGVPADIPADRRTPMTFEALDGDGKPFDSLVVAANRIRVAASPGAGGASTVDILLTEPAARRFEDFTGRHLGKRLRVRIGDVVVIPGAWVREPIRGGRIALGTASAGAADRIRRLLGH